MSHGQLGALLLLGLPLLLGNKGCEADLHEGDAEAVHEDGHEQDAGTGEDGDDGDETPPSSSPKPPAGDPTGEPKPTPVLDAGTPAKDAGTVTPTKDAGPGGTAGRCGTRGGVTCAKDEFCQFAANTMCGAADQGGSCMKRPEVCTLIYQPVCGCDGKTYGSACAANGAGVSVAKEGECKGSGGNPPSGMTCGGFAGLQCGSGMFCNYEPAVGGQGCVDIADGSGVCQTQPTACTKEYKPVCGCDHRTYGNACDAHSKGVSVMHTGACTEVDCKAIGGRAVDGIGPAPKCASGETDMGAIVYSSGAIAIEGTICCVK